MCDHYCLHVQGMHQTSHELTVAANGTRSPANESHRITDREGFPD